MTTNTFLTQSDFKRTVHHTDKLRVAAYIRVSTDSDDQENSFEVQKAYFEEHCQKTISGYPPEYMLITAGRVLRRKVVTGLIV